MSPRRAFDSRSTSSARPRGHASRGSLKVLAQSAAKAPVASADLQKVDSAIAFYEEKVRPELLSSRIVPVLLAIGEKLPYVGRPATLPTR